MITHLEKIYLVRSLSATFRSRSLRFLPVLVLVISLFVTYELWKIARQDNELALQKEFQFNVLDASQLIKQRMLTYDQLLRGMQGLFAASEKVNRPAFHAYVNALNLEKKYPGVHSLEFQLLVPSAKKEKNIAKVRREGFPEYSIRPNGVRDVYSTVLYIEPFSGSNLHAIGFDNFADPVRRSAMEKVRDTGQCNISPKVRLAQETNEKGQAEFLMWLPVYKNGSSQNTIEERRENLTGWVAATFRMEELMNSIFDRKNRQLDIEIYDGNDISEQSLMYDADSIRRTIPSNVFKFQSVKKMEIAGHKWTIVMSSLPEFDQRMNTQKSFLVAFTGVLIALLLTMITEILVYARSRALQFAQRLNQELVERKRAEAGIRLTEKVFQTVDAAVLVTDRSTRIIRVNPAFTAITGYSPEDVIGKTPRILSSGAHTREFYKALWTSLKETGNWQGEIYNRRKNGEFFTEWVTINQVHDEDGNLTNYVSMFSDISERKAAEERMVTLAHYDPLTGLPNRTLLTDRMQQALAAAKREKSHMALMFIDLDRFKPVNDTRGHHIGDLMLKDVAKRMLECLRESDSAARIGGDEFVVLLPMIEAADDAVAVAEKIKDALSQPFVIDGHSLNISSSIGVAVYPDNGGDEKTLLANADSAMYAAKESGRNSVILFKAGMRRHGK